MSRKKNQYSQPQAELPKQTPPMEFDTTDEELKEFWREAAKELVKNSTDAVEGLAKQFLTVAGILEGLYFHAITFTNLRGYVSGWILFGYLLPVVLLLVTILASLYVLNPRRTSVNIANWRSSKSSFENINDKKLFALRIASFFLGLAVISLIVAVWMYLAI